MHAKALNWREPSTWLRRIGWKLHRATWPFRQAWHVAQWLPVLWRDADFDQGYLIKIVVFKLRRMADHFEAHQIHVGWEETVREIRETIEHFERHSNPEHKDAPPMPAEADRWLEFEPIPGRSGRMLKPSTPEQIAWAHAVEAFEQENWDAAWELIRKHGRGWWD